MKPLERYVSTKLVDSIKEEQDCEDIANAAQESILLAESITALQRDANDNYRQLLNSSQNTHSQRMVEASQDIASIHTLIQDYYSASVQDTEARLQKERQDHQAALARYTQLQQTTQQQTTEIQRLTNEEQSLNQQLNRKPPGCLLS